MDRYSQFGLRSEADEQIRRGFRDALARAGLSHDQFLDALSWYRDHGQHLGADPSKLAESFREFASNKGWGAGHVAAATSAYDVIAEQGPAAVLATPSAEEDAATITRADELLRTNPDAYWRDQGLQELALEARERRLAAPPPEPDRAAVADQIERQIAQRDVDKFAEMLRKEPAKYWASPELQRQHELGAGTASKTCILLDAALRFSDNVTYLPVDVCSNALELACRNVASQLPQARLEPVIQNYVTHPLQLEPFDGTTLALYVGASIGNFSPDEARLILRNLRFHLQWGDALLLGTDMAKDEAALLAAYDDTHGITAAFNLNILRRLNRGLGADFDAANFRHRVIWNSVESRVEMPLESTREQDVCIEEVDVDLHFSPGETIHTENSYKFTDQGIQSLLYRAGFAVTETWKDSLGWYALTLACLR